MNESWQLGDIVSYELNIIEVPANTQPILNLEREQAVQAGQEQLVPSEFLSSGFESMDDLASPGIPRLKRTRYSELTLQERGIRAEMTLRCFRDPTCDRTAPPNFEKRLVSQLLFARLNLQGVHITMAGLSRKLDWSTPKVSQALKPVETPRHLKLRDDLYAELNEHLMARLFENTAEAEATQSAIHPSLLPLIHKYRREYGVGLNLVVPGGLIDRDSKNYIDRNTDDLFDDIRQGRYRCWNMIFKVAGSPDSGKSSLSRQIMEDAQQQGDKVVYVDAAQCIDSDDESDAQGSYDASWHRRFIAQVNPSWLAENDRDSLGLLDIRNAIQALQQEEQHTTLVIDNHNLMPQTKNLHSMCRATQQDLHAEHDQRSLGISIVMFGLENALEIDEVPSFALQNFSYEEVEKLSKAYPDANVTAQEVFEITGGQPLLTNSLLRHGKGERFMFVARNHLMKIAREVIRSKEALAELDDLTAGSTTGSFFYALAALGVVSGGTYGTKEADWSASFYKDHLSQAVRLLQRAADDEVA